jgi:hypothetical protein
VPHKDLDGFLHNLNEDVHSFVTGIPAAFRVAQREGAKLTGNLDWVKDIQNHPEYLTKELRNTWTSVIKNFTDTYKDGVGEALYKHPFSVVLDATTIADIAGVGLKSAGKAAMGGAARELMENGLKTGTLGEEIFKLGDTVQRMPGRIIKAPFDLAYDAALKVPQIRTFAESVAMTPLGLAEKDAMTSQVLKGRVTAAQKMEEILERDLSRSQRSEYWELRDGLKPLDAASDPILSERAQLWQEANKGYEEWMKQMGLKTTEELEAASLKPLAERLFNQARDSGEAVGELYDFKSGAMKRQWLEAAADYKDGNNPWGRATSPSYHPFFAERTFDLGEALEAMKSQANTIQYVKRLEKKTGYGANLISNPDVVEARAMLQINELKSMVDYISDSTMRLGKPVKLGADIPAGHVIMDPILKRYIEKGLTTGVDLLTKNLAEAMRAKTGMSMYELLEQGYQKTAKQLQDMKIWEDAKDGVRNPEAWQVAIPKEVAYLIESQLKGVTGPMRFYDKIINTWRNVVLRLMPRFYINNLLGHSVLLLFGGHLPFIKSMARDEKLLPAEALSAGGISVDAGYRSDLLGHIPGMDDLSKFLERVAEQTGSVPRQLLMNTKTQNILKSEAAIGNTAAQALLAGKTAEEATNLAYAARKQLQELGSKQALAAKAASGEDIENLIQYASGRGKPVMTPGQKNQLAKIDSKLQDLQLQLKKEKALANLEQEGATINQMSTAAIRRKSLIDNMKLLTEKREAIEPLGRAKWVTSDMSELENLQKLSAEREYLTPQAAIVERAITQMETFLGNYGRMHPLEKQYIRRLIPFWTFQKTMAKLLFTMPAVAPKAGFLWNHYASLMIDAANDDRLPDRFRNAIPIGHELDSEGDVNTIFMKIDGFSPFRDYGMTSIAGHSIPKLLDPMQNPFVKMFVESTGGYDHFVEKPFVGKTDFMTLNGAVYRFNADTNELEQVVPQKPLLRSLFDQIPQLKVVQEALDSFDKTRNLANRGEEFQMTPQDPEGHYVYNRQWWWAASRTMGFPVHVASPEKVEEQHEKLVQSMIERFRAAALRADPDTRDKLEHILEDLQRGGFKLREWGD